MISGVVTEDREAKVRLVVRGAFGLEEEIEAVVDTGFNGSITLPSSVIAGLALTHHSFTSAMLGDGSRVDLNRYEGVVIWDGREREVLVLETDGGALIGMALMEGCELVMHIIEGGSVCIETSP